MSKELSAEQQLKLKSFEDRYNNISYELGLLQLEKYETQLYLTSLNEAESALMQEYVKYSTEMRVFSAELEAEFAKDSINMESGKNVNE